VVVKDTAWAFDSRSAPDTNQNQCLQVVRDWPDTLGNPVALCKVPFTVAERIALLVAPVIEHGEVMRVCPSKGSATYWPLSGGSASGFVQSKSVSIS
jgi:hypothetical protein